MAALGALTMFLDEFGGGTVNLGASVETSSAYIQSKALDFGDGAFVKFLEKVISNIKLRKLAPFLNLEIYGSDDEEGPFELLDTISVADFDPQYTDPPGKRFYKIRYTDASVSVRWALHGMTFYGEPGGEEF